MPIMLSDVLCCFPVAVLQVIHSSWLVSSVSLILLGVREHTSPKAVQEERDVEEEDVSFVKYAGETS